MLLNTMANGPS